VACRVWHRCRYIKTNEEVLGVESEERKLLEEIRKRQSRWLDQMAVGERC
jgi:hypothetical protein